MFEVLIAIVAFILVFAVIVYKRGNDLRKLVAKGIETQARVEKIFHFTDSAGLGKYRLRYVFTAGNGREYKRTVSLSLGEREKVTEGVQLPVVYMADNPNINALSELVSQARKALKK